MVLIGYLAAHILINIYLLNFVNCCKLQIKESGFSFTVELVSDSTGKSNRIDTRQCSLVWRFLNWNGIKAGFTKCEPSFSEVLSISKSETGLTTNPNLDRQIEYPVAHLCQ